MSQTLDGDLERQRSPSANKFLGEEEVQAQLEGSKRTSTSMKRSLRRWLEMVSTSPATSAELK